MKHFLCLLLCFIAFPAAGTGCIAIGSPAYLSAAAKAAGYTAKPWSGAADLNVGPTGLQHTISLSDTSSFQPSGTLLASSTVSFLTGASKTPYEPNQILFRCNLGNAGSLYEYYSTNGDSPYAGKHITNEVEDAYYSYVRNVAFRLTNTATGEHYSRYWKKRMLNPDDLYSDGTYIYVPASAFSDITIELFKITGTAIFASDAEIYTWAWSQPLGYIAFQGGGLSQGLYEGADHLTNYHGWYSAWPSGWGLTNSAITFIRGAICAIQDYPSVVLLPTANTTDLENGESTQSAFDITLICESFATAGTASIQKARQVAMGFLVNNASAVSAARNLGLTSGSTGITTLLDTHYGSGGVASGVGITIHSAKTGSPINLLSTSISAHHGAANTGNVNGWYGYDALTNLSGEDGSGNNLYTGSFIASLGKIGNQTVTPGTVNAQLQVLVSLQ